MMLKWLLKPAVIKDGHFSSTKEASWFWGARRAVVQQDWSLEQFGHIVLEMNTFLRNSCLQSCAVCLLWAVLMACHESLLAQLVKFLICSLITQGPCIYSSALLFSGFALWKHLGSPVEDEMLFVMGQQWQARSCNPECRYESCNSICEPGNGGSHLQKWESEIGPSN